MKRVNLFSVLMFFIGVLIVALAVSFDFNGDLAVSIFGGAWAGWWFVEIFKKQFMDEYPLDLPIINPSTEEDDWD